MTSSIPNADSKVAVGSAFLPILPTLSLVEDFSSKGPPGSQMSVFCTYVPHPTSVHDQNRCPDFHPMSYFIPLDQNTSISKCDALYFYLLFFKISNFQLVHLFLKCQHFRCFLNNSHVWKER